MIGRILRLLSERERVLVLIAVPVISLLLMWLLLISPQQEQRFRLAQQLEYQQRELTWMQNARRQLESLRTQAHSAADSQIALYQHVQTLLKNEGLAAQRIQGETDRQVNVWLTKLSYQRSLELLDRLVREKLIVREVKLSAGAEQGRLELYLSIAW